MDTWTEALITMMNSANPVYVRSDVKKEIPLIQDYSPAADSSLYSPTTTGLEFELELSQTDMIRPRDCESYETTPTSAVRSASSPEPDDSQKQFCSSTTPAAASDNINRSRNRIHLEFSEAVSISTVSGGLLQSSPRSYSGSEPDQEQIFCSSTTTLLGGLGRRNSQNHYKDDDAPKRLCLVCGDIASGFHYGVASCEACKAFFKRTIQGNIEYTCPATNDCEINKRRRKACQACRFHKCITVGMHKEGVRLDRVRGGRRKYRRVNPYTVNASPAGVNEEGSTKLLQLLSQNEPEMSSVDWSDHGTTDMDPVTRTLWILSEIYDRELVSTIGWAKQIPGFLELPLNDQMRLLQTTWPEVLTLSLAYRSLPLCSVNPKLKWSKEFTMDEEEANKCSMTEFFQQCLQIATRLEQLSISKEEYLLLKALVLANSDAHVGSYAPLKRLRDNLILEIMDCTIARHGTAGFLVNQLFLCLPCIRQIDAILRKIWTALKREMTRIPMNKLFLEMLETPGR